MTGGDNTGSSNELAEKRTDWAEDRTMLANERTFAGWMRTGLASVGLGLGFQAIFKAVEPTWLAKSVATVFILIGIFIFWSAYRNSAALLKRLSSHAVEPVKTKNTALLSAFFIIGASALGLVLWIV